jgi:hypothetical protein
MAGTGNKAKEVKGLSDHPIAAEPPSIPAGAAFPIVGIGASAGGRAAPFLQKPFTPAAVTGKVRETLDMSLNEALG